jgi:rare lipoprotein A (peptidoglycan hydrolase)
MRLVNHTDIPSELSRIIDLSQHAFLSLAPLAQGIIDVTVEACHDP